MVGAIYIAAAIIVFFKPFKPLEEVFKWRFQVPKREFGPYLMHGGWS